MKLIIINDGDSSVGLQGFNLEVEIKDADENVFDEDFTDRLKQFFKIELEHHDGRLTILTEKEYQDLIDMEVDYLERLNEGE